MRTDRRFRLSGFHEIDRIAIRNQLRLGDLPRRLAVGKTAADWLPRAVRPHLVDLEETVGSLDDKAVAARHPGSCVIHRAALPQGECLTEMRAVARALTCPCSATRHTPVRGEPFRSTRGR